VFRPVSPKAQADVQMVLAVRMDRPTRFLVWVSSRNPKVLIGHVKRLAAGFSRARRNADSYPRLSTRHPTLGDDHRILDRCDFESTLRSVPKRGSNTRPSVWTFLLRHDPATTVDTMGVIPGPSRWRYYRTLHPSPNMLTNLLSAVPREPQSIP
jgi:hypothetical protein